MLFYYTYEAQEVHVELVGLHVQLHERRITVACYGSVVDALSPYM